MQVGNIEESFMFDINCKTGRSDIYMYIGNIYQYIPIHILKQ